MLRGGKHRRRGHCSCSCSWFHACSCSHVGLFMLIPIAILSAVGSAQVTANSGSKYDPSLVVVVVLVVSLILLIPLISLIPFGPLVPFDLLDPRLTPLSRALINQRSAFSKPIRQAVSNLTNRGVLVLVLVLVLVFEPVATSSLWVCPASSTWRGSSRAMLAAAVHEQRVPLSIPQSCSANLR